MKWMLIAAAGLVAWGSVRAGDGLPRQFENPPDSARPGVYWYFMDGNLSREGMTRDLESMKAAGLGHVLFLEVNVGVSRGHVDFLSDEWQNLYAHAVHETERLGLELMLGSGPGWTGSGGPWVKPEQSMQHLVGTQVDVEGPGPFTQKLPVAPPRKAYFGLPGQLHAAWSGFFRDVAVLAYPTPAAGPAIPDLDEKALYLREPFTSKPGVRPNFDAPADFQKTPADGVIPRDRVLDLTDRLKPDGSLDWQIPAGKWTVARFVSRNNGMSTRPAPAPGIGFECDKWDPAALDAHFAEYGDKLLKKVGPRPKDRGWTMLHIDSWEMGAQNWTPRFREEFKRRCGYDPQPFYLAYLGRIVGSREETERFLWDLRQVGSDLIVEYHAEHLKELGRRNGFTLSIEPYDMHPGNDFDLGSVADLPMCEFWSVGFNSTFSCQQASSIAHVMGCPVVGAESFTGAPGENWRFHPGYLKNQGDWAFGVGVNRFTYHTFAHKPDESRPGMVMGPYGVHWDRGQTWWPMAAAYHRYVTRCQYLLRQGNTVADILYLMPEGAPNAFQPPVSAFDGDAALPDRRGYNFDGCSARRLIERAAVCDGRIVFPGGASYALLVLPDRSTMTPELLGKLETLVKAGATVVGEPPRKSPSLVNYPACDRTVAERAAALWGGPESSATHNGRGRVIRRGAAGTGADASALAAAKWIWYPQGEPAKSYPVGQAFFRRELVLDPNRKLAAARIEATADNDFTVTVNGAPVGGGDNFHFVRSFDLKPLLKAGTNVLAVRAGNGGDEPNPAGLIAALRLRYADGAEEVVVSDAQWRTALKEDGGDGWKPALVLGPMAMAPWHLKHEPGAAALYPEYDFTAEILDGMNIAPDFVSAGPVRYTHRRTEDRELYFVANRSDRPVQADGVFRVSGRAPELWDAVTGKMRALPQYKEANGLTTVSLRFEPYQSFFVVFPKPSAAAVKPVQSGANFADPAVVCTLDGAWDVAFDPALGAPAQVRFDRLEDWTARPEPGIRYYSGLATYRRTFDVPQSAIRNPQSPILLDLGSVHVMARVRVNGQDCGTAWTAPLRVDVTKAVKPAGNVLEIEVANLWPNRMIGDLREPGKTYTQTTYRPFKATDALLPSGLLGPVRVLVRP